jgi:hypothetical protein
MFRCHVGHYKGICLASAIVSCSHILAFSPIAVTSYCRNKVQMPLYYRMFTNKNTANFEKLQVLKHFFVLAEIICEADPRVYTKKN